MSDAETRQLEAAARWYFELDQAGHDPQLERRFHAWLQRDPDHASAFNDIVRSLAAIDGQEDRSELSAAAHEATIGLRRRNRLVTGYKLAGLGALLLAVTGSLAFRSAPAPVEYANFQDGVRTVRLADNSEIVLDRRTVVQVNYASGVRHIDLLAGQARFKVAHDPERPFEVLANRRVVVAKGTDFVVSRPDETLSVTLLSGRVDVAIDPPCINSLVSLCRFLRRDNLVMRPGERLSGPLDDGAMVRDRVNATNATAWQVGLLIADNERLGALVQQLNRYAGKNIIELADPSLKDLRVDGAFRIGKPVAVAEALQQLFDIDAQFRPYGRVILTKKMHPPKNNL
ncbi:FecR domain-containing protein [Sphingobium phenoxybenzoativorans]|uniref:FecR domain-containing protein n=1 Tax=Sphingobium phenoxybenzoativorans TaxID=1592790 RepID=A0A975K4B8_9SPHN|nr:FecR domain-containing protein [Sphingobium phenoxybenzoativorans]QUT03873.1 FecR domain-containing protein [Sphingobium phenoxybenzoativorans]